MHVQYFFKAVQKSTLNLISLTAEEPNEFKRPFTVVTDAVKNFERDYACTQPDAYFKVYGSCCFNIILYNFREQ